jgi:hypothetical protein
MRLRLPAFGDAMGAEGTANLIADEVQKNAPDLARLLKP